ncbi:hypothetical protein [Paenibacillus fonticola]|uniref:hypothetical protein n=1 Tax=Paenibacillus fonticola TaxID=379896 RepID=UPI000365A3D1|nr:hypothetical protein [Paenibacillus fonticola]
MKNKWRTYGGITGITGVTVILLLIAYIIYIQIGYFRLLEHSQRESKQRQEMDLLLRSKEKQVEFYFNKMNELISVNQELVMQMNLWNGGEITRLDDQLIRDVIETNEFKEIVAEHRKYYGVIDIFSIPENETLGGLKYKVQESIAAGYDLLPSYYGITNVLRCLHTKEFSELNSIFQEHFGDVIPTEEIYGSMEELNEIVNKSVQEGENLLPEYYGYGRK